MNLRKKAILAKHHCEIKAFQLTSVRYREAVISLLYQIKQYFSDVGQNACELWLLKFIVKRLGFFYMTGDFRFLNKMLKLSETLEEWSISVLVELMNLVFLTHWWCNSSHVSKVIIILLFQRIFQALTVLTLFILFVRRPNYYAVYD